jgi:hypothetical protein
MPSFRLRVRSTEIDLPVGELTIGRGEGCFLRIDDEMVSRKHARLFVTARTVAFEDLGSRNGSRVNGGRIRGSVELKIGDTFDIGSQTFQLIRGGDVERATQTMIAHRSCHSCRLLVEAGDRVCPHCGAEQTAAREDTIHDFDDTTDAGRFSAGNPDTRPQVLSKSVESSFTLLTTLGDKLLTLGRVEEAERMVGPRLRDLLARAEAGERLSDAVIEEALWRGLRLAAATTRGEWYAWIFELALHTGRRLDDRLLDELHANMMAHKPGAGAALRGYLAGFDSDQPEQAQHRRRLEALLRFCRD